MALKMFLELEGHDAVAVESGEEALQLLRNSHDSRFDMILLDLNTSGITALEFMDDLRIYFTSQKAPLPLVGLVSGAVGIEFEARRLQADFYLKKPCNPDELLAHLDQLRSSASKFVSGAVTQSPALA